MPSRILQNVPIETISYRHIPSIVFLYDPLTSTIICGTVCGTPQADMKRSNLHKALTAKRVLNETKPGRYADGGGLYLDKEKTKQKQKVLRIVVPARGKRCDISLGSVNTKTHTQTQKTTNKWRKLAKDGGDPITVRKKNQKQKTKPTNKQTTHNNQEDQTKAGK